MTEADFNYHTYTEPDNPFKAGDRVVTNELEDRNGALLADIIKTYGVKPYYTVVSVNDVWIRIEDERDGYHNSAFKYYVAPVTLDEELFTL